jgi:short chain dehydrogenase
MHPSLLSQFDLSGKTALVTGASRGLGISFARGLAKANCNLVIAARDLDRLTVVASDLDQYGGRVVPIQQHLALVLPSIQLHQLPFLLIAEFPREITWPRKCPPARMPVALMTTF